MSNTKKEFPLLPTPFKTYLTNSLISVLFCKKELERDLASLFGQAHRSAGNMYTHGNVQLTQLNRTVEHPYLHNGANDALAARFAKPIVLAPGDLSDQFIQLLTNIDVLSKRLSDFKVLLRKIFSRSKTTEDLQLYFDKAINPVIKENHFCVVARSELFNYFSMINDTYGIENYAEWDQANLTEEQVDAHLDGLEKYIMSFKKHMLIQTLAG